MKLDELLQGATEVPAPSIGDLTGGAVDLKQAARDTAGRYQLDPDIFDRLVQQESQYNPAARSPKGAIGLTQLMPGTASDMQVQDPNDPLQNLEGGAKYLRKMLDAHDQNYDLALAAYNAGPEAVKKYKGIPPYDETQKYVAKVRGSQVAAQPAQPKGLLEQAQDALIGQPAPGQEPDFMSKDWFTSTLPKSINRAALGAVTFPYQLAKSVTDPVFEQLDKPEFSVGELAAAEGKNVLDQIQGLGEFMGAPLGVYGLDKFKEVWKNEPGSALMGVAPFLGGAAGMMTGSKSALEGKPVEIPPVVDTPLISEAAQRARAEMVEGAATAKATRIEKSLKAYEGHTFATEEGRVRSIEKAAKNGIELEAYEADGKLRVRRKAVVEEAPAAISVEDGLTPESYREMQDAEAAIKKLEEAGITGYERQQQSDLSYKLVKKETPVPADITLADLLEEGKIDYKAEQKGLPLTDADRQYLAEGKEAAAKWRDQRAAKRAADAKKQELDLQEAARESAGTGRDSLIETEEGTKTQGEVDLPMVDAQRAELEAMKAKAAKEPKSVQSSNKLPAAPKGISKPIYEAMQQGSFIVKNADKSGWVIDIGGKETKVPEKTLQALNVKGVVEYNVENGRFELKGQEPAASVKETAPVVEAAPAADALPVDDTIFPTHQEAVKAARRMAEETQMPWIPEPQVDGSYRIKARGKEVSNEEPTMLYTFPGPIWDHVKSLRDQLRSEPKPDTPEGKIANKYVEDSLGWLDKHVGQPRWLAKGNPRLEPLIDAADRMSENFSSWFAESLQLFKEMMKLSKDQRKTMWEMMWVVEGKDIPEVGNKWYGLEADGRLYPDPAHYEKYQKWAEKYVSPDVAAKMTEMRMSLDNDLLNIWNHTLKEGTVNKDTLANLKKQVFQIPNYLPHTRTGQYVLEGWAKDAKGVERKVFDAAVPLSTVLDNVPYFKDKWNKKRFDKRAAQMIPKLMKDPEIAALGDITWKTGKRIDKSMSYVESLPTLASALEDTIAAAKSKIADPDVAAALDTQMKDAITNVLKTRGGWGHSAKRQGILGFEKTDMERVLYQYKMGLYAHLSKSVGASEMATIMRDISSSRPNEKSFAIQYVKDMMEPTGKLEKTAGIVRGLASIKYLSPVVKSAVVNLTTAHTTGVARLAADSGVKAEIFINKGMTRYVGHITGTKILDTTRQKFVDNLIHNGTIQNVMINEIRRDVEGASGKGFGGWGGVVFDAIMGPMKHSEIFSRASTALAAYDQAVAGAVTNKTMVEKYGLPTKPISKLTPEMFSNISAYAREVVLDSHGMFGKVNKPSFARTGRIGKLAAGAYTFKNYSQNVLHLYSHLARQGLDGNGKASYAIARSIAAQAALTGVSGLWLANTFKQMYQAWMPPDKRIMGDDPIAYIREQFPEEYQDIATYGLPAALGVSLGGSYSMEASDSLEELFGVPVSMVKDVMKAHRAWSAGDMDRAIEAIVAPALLRNYYTAQRLHDVGETTVTGQPINFIGEEGPRKLDDAGFWKKFFGFQPLEMQKSWDAYQTIESINKVRNKQMNKFASTWTNAGNKGDSVTQEKVLEDLQEWNNYWLERSKLQYVITIKEALKARSRPDVGPVQMRGKAMEIEESYR